MQDGDVAIILYLVGVSAGPFLVGFVLESILRPRASWWRGWYVPAAFALVCLSLWGVLLGLSLTVWTEGYNDISAEVAWVYVFPFVVLIPVTLAAVGVGVAAAFGPAMARALRPARGPR